MAVLLRRRRPGRRASALGVLLGLARALEAGLLAFRIRVRSHSSGRFTTPCRTTQPGGAVAGRWPPMSGRGSACGRTTGGAGTHPGSDRVASALATTDEGRAAGPGASGAGPQAPTLATPSAMATAWRPSAGTSRRDRLDATRPAAPGSVAASSSAMARSNQLSNRSARPPHEAITNSRTLGGVPARHRCTSSARTAVNQYAERPATATADSGRSIRAHAMPLA